MRISFVWQGSSNPQIFNQWNDGLREAMRIIGDSHTVTYHEPSDELEGLVMYWEAPCTINGPDAWNYNRIRELPNKKVLLFAGGPIQPEWLDGFDHVFVESKINCEELCQLNIPHSTAFGINEKIFKPEKQPKVFDGIHQGTCASWKRQWLVAEALGNKAVLCGRYQLNDRRPFDEAKELGTLVLPELPAEAVSSVLNASYTMVQTSDFWGGGQRATLEAMACNVPVVCMEDSPKNREFIEESGFGEVVSPGKEQIKYAVGRLKEWTPEQLELGRAYIESKWTSQHYADSLLKVIE